MKEKKVLGWEILASLLFLVGFFLIRVALAVLEIGINGETIATLLTVSVFLIAVLIYVSGREKRFISFSFDALILAIAGYFLWELKEVEAYALWFGLAVFTAFVLISVVNTVKKIKAGPESQDEQKPLLECHSLITYGLAIKVVIMGLGVVAVEKFVLPMIAG